MASKTQKKKTENPCKVIVEVEEMDDSLRLTLKGLDALKELKKNMSSMGCCVPVAVACTGTTDESAGD